MECAPWLPSGTLRVVRTWDSADEEERRPRMMAPTRCTSHVSCPSMTASACASTFPVA
jgi:hypothetical protein